MRILLVLFISSLWTPSVSALTEVEVDGIQFRLDVFRMNLVYVASSDNAVDSRSLRPPDYCDFNIVLLAKNVSSNEVTIPLGVSKPDAYVFDQGVFWIDLNLVVPSYEVDNEDVNIKPSLSSLNLVSLKPGEVALIMELSPKIPCETPMERVRVELWVDPDLKDFYDVWTGKARIDKILDQQ